MNVDLDVNVLLAQLDELNAELGRQRLVTATLAKQVELRDEEIAELKKARPTKRAAKKA